MTRARLARGSERSTAEAAAAADPSGIPALSSLVQMQGRDITRVERDLRSYLHRRGEFPQSHRLAIWRFLLRLPSNTEAFAELEAAGTHPSASDILARYPIKDGRLARRLVKVCSCLAHWQPVLGEVPYLPLLAFPFVAAFGPGQALPAFETVATFLMSWAGSWLELFPHAPLGTLAACEQALEQTDPELSAHLRRMHCPATRWAWPLLRSVLSEVLPRPHWGRLMDHLIARGRDAALLPAAAVAYVRS